MARDIPGVLDVLFPRLSGGLVASMNKKMFSFEGISPIPDEIVERSGLQKAMLFELAMTRAELVLGNEPDPEWEKCLRISVDRQRRHYDARVPVTLQDDDIIIASHAANNLVSMLQIVGVQYPNTPLQVSPKIPGLGWIAGGNGDFCLGSMLIEVKHTDRNFVSGDFRQVLMYWLLKYAASIETNEAVWSDCLLLNPRRNSALLFDFDYLLRSASANSNRVELFELLRSIVIHDFDRS